MLCAAVPLLVAAVICGVKGNSASIGKHRGQLVLAAYLCLPAGVLLTSAGFIGFQITTPTMRAVGIIDSAALHSSGRDYRTDLTLRISPQSWISLHAFGRSPFFHAGQSTDVLYQAHTGDIIRARFLGPSGSPIGVFNGTDRRAPYILALLGIFIAWAGIRRYRRDPIAEVQTRLPNDHPLGSIDLQSTLDLSATKQTPRCH